MTPDIDGHTCVLGLAEALAAMRGGSLDPAAYRAALVRRARQVEPAVRAFTCFAPDAPTEPEDGPLGGAIVAIKDLIDTRDLPTSYGSPLYAGHRPDADAWIVARLKALGAVVIGKTVTTEFAWREPGPTRNPRNLGHTPGGSSSGSAAAVAAGCAPLAVGTQTFGSVIRPAAFCGIVGFKPSHGRIPTTGAHPLAPSLDHLGLFTRSVADAALAFGAIVGEDAPSMANSPLRIALVRTEFWGRAQDDQRRAIDAAAESLRQAGATVSETALPAAFESVGRDAWTILAVEAARQLAPTADRSPSGVSRHIAELVEDGARTPETRYRASLSSQRTLRTEFEAIFDSYDAVLTLPAMGAAPSGLASTGDPGPCIAWSHIGVPALTMPVTLDGRGLPLGLQLIGRFGRDAELLSVAAWCEKAIDARIGIASAEAA